MRIIFIFLCTLLSTYSYCSEKTWQEAEQVINKRCVVCHGCYDAPCQLKMESYSGLRRGSNKIRVYDGDTRLVNTQPNPSWNRCQLRERMERLRLPTPVLPNSAKDYNSSVFYKMIQLKMENPLKVNTKLGENFDVGTNRSQVCPSKQEFSDDYDKHWGMPWGMAPLSSKEYNTLKAGLKPEPPGKDHTAVSRYDKKMIKMWEEFLNNPNTKYRLTARYIYEHLF